MCDTETKLCVLCDEPVRVDENNDVLDGVLELETFEENKIYVCEGCRYFGATVHYLQWEHPSAENKFGVDIFGALEQVERIFANIEQNIDDLTAKITRMPEGEDRTNARSLVTSICQLIGMGKTNISVSIGNLREFGK